MGTAVNSATYNYTPPTSLYIREKRNVTVTLTNTGRLSTWLATGTSATQLGVYYGGVSDAVGAWTESAQKFVLPNNVLPGNSITLTIQMKGALTAGNQVLRFRMLNGTNAWFSTFVKSNITINGLAAVFAGTPTTTVRAGQRVTYTLTLTNLDSVTWNATGTNPVRLGVYTNGTSDAVALADRAKTVCTTNECRPGQSVTLTISFTAPTTPGTYTLRQRLVKEGILWSPTLLKSTLTVT